MRQASPQWLAAAEFVLVERDGHLDRPKPIVCAAGEALIFNYLAAFAAAKRGEGRFSS
jgi:hypothetical protein